jgi:hypothetical protein
MPLVFMPHAEKENNHYVKTLRHYASRQAQPIELDRVAYLPTDFGAEVVTFAGERIQVTGISHSQPARISLKGVFTGGNIIHAEKYHLHPPHFRQLSSYVGILLVIMLWGIAFFRQRRFLFSNRKASS